MKRWSILLSLLLCAALLLPCAAAEEAYIPGAAARALLADVLAGGRMIRGDMTMGLDMDASLLGLGETEQAMLGAVSDLLSRVTISAAAGKTEDGIRLELGAALADAQGGAPVTADAAANLSRTGLSVESSLLAGRRVTARWETLMAMAGMSDGDIMTFLSIRDMDWAAMLPQLAAAAQEYMRLAAGIAAPYAGTIADWFYALPRETALNVPAAENYPAAAAELTITLTAKDAGVLIARLAGQVKEDETLCGLLSLLIQEAYTGEGDAPTVAQLCDELTAAAASLTDTDNPLRLFIGLDENSRPLYAQLCAFSGDTLTGLVEVIAYTDADGLIPWQFSILAFNGEGEATDGVFLAGTAGGGSFTLEGEAYAQSAQVMAMQYALTAYAPEGQQGVVIGQSAGLAVDGGTQFVQAVMNTETTATLTEDGGELIDNVITMEIAADEQTFPLTALQTAILYPTEDGLHGSYSTRQSMPAAGVNAIGLDVILSSPAYDPAATAALRETAFETSSRTDMDALISSVMSAAQLTLNAAMQALPTEVQSILKSL